MAQSPTFSTGSPSSPVVYVAFAIAAGSDARSLGASATALDVAGDQDLAGQVAELTAAGGAKVYREKVSDAQVDRAELGKVIGRPGVRDVLVVTATRPARPLNPQRRNRRG